MQISLSFASAEIYTKTYNRENNKRLVQVSPTYSWADQRLREHDYPPALLRPEFRNAAARVLAKHRGLKTRIKMMNNTQTSRIVRHASPHRRERCEAHRAGNAPTDAEFT